MRKRLTRIAFFIGCAAALTGVRVAGQDTAPACDGTGVCTLPGAAPADARPVGGRRFWAEKRLFTEAPPLEVARWLTDPPETKGKFLVIEFWRTWCGACKRGTPFMNGLQTKYGKELAVIGITGETEEVVRAYKGPKKEYFLALDRPKTGAAAGEGGDAAGQPAEGTIPREKGQGAYEALFGVWGWPHVVILEPRFRTVVWEGYPGQKGYELTEAMIERLLAVERAARAESGGR